MDHTVDHIVCLLADRGYLISRQRRAVIRELCQAGSIDDVEDFWLSLRQRHHIGWSTVYNTIKLLVQERLVYAQCKEKRGQRYFLAARWSEVSE